MITVRSPGEKAWAGQWTQPKGFDFRVVISHVENTRVKKKMKKMKTDEEGEEESRPSGLYTNFCERRSKSK